MSKWSHSLCGDCYEEKEPGRKPVALPEAEVEACCACGSSHNSGIYYRADPDSLRCKGVHKEPEEEETNG